MTNEEATDKTPPAGAQGAHAAPKKAAAKKAASPKQGGTKGKKVAKPAPKKATKAAGDTAHKEAGAGRAGSKGAQILELIRRPKGATLAEIMKATEWQAHSVRGYISSAAKKNDINIESSKNDAGERVYKIK